MFRINGQRAANLRKPDCPAVAKALTAYARGKADVERGIEKETPYIFLAGRDFRVLILGEDWDKILPYIRDGYFSDLLFPSTSSVSGSLQQGGAPPTPPDFSTIDVTDRPLYLRILAVLENLFPIDYPTSPL